MSASLVGSEMCIRDRSLSCAGEGAVPRGRQSPPGVRSLYSDAGEESPEGERPLEWVEGPGCPWLP
eukprot:15042706-Alexandrium_andersonii.AAC.1